MPKLDLLVVGSSGAGKTALVRAFATNEDHHAGGEVDPLCKQVGMSVRSQLYSLGVDTLQHTVRLNLWHPAMRELTEKETSEPSLLGVNQQLRVRYQRDYQFHGVIVCYDTTDGASFT